MKKFLFFIFFFFVSLSVLYAQNTSGNVQYGTDTNLSGGANVSGSSGDFGFFMGGVFGAVSVDGQNYQKVGLRPEFTFWKFGICFDLVLLFDDDGKIRKEDWDEPKDYVDKIYYVRFGSKGDPFYFKFGSIDSVTLGYGALMNGYNNTTEYPSYKRQGLNLGFATSALGAEIVVGDFKELMGHKKAVMMGGRAFVKPMSRLTIAGSLVGDFNEYKGLHDRDGDGIPDRVDAYPDDKRYNSTADYYIKHGVDSAVVDDLIAKGLISSGYDFNLNKKRSQTGFWAADASILIYDGSFVKFDIYGQFAQSMNTYGWGFTAPGIRLKFGTFAEIYGDYRQQSDEFMFGYYNDTYDLERARFVEDQNGKLVITTKKDRLEEARELRGYFIGGKLNVFNIATAKCEFQDMQWGSNEKDLSIRGSLALNTDIIPVVVISKAEAFYVQNNVGRLRWKTESTMWGGVVGLGIGENVDVNFMYLVTYDDKNGDGRIKGDEEMNTNVSVYTSARF